MQIANGTLPNVSIHSLTGCAGELLVILENMNKLLPYIRVASFPFAQSKNQLQPVDIAFVEGSVSQPHDLEKLKEIRQSARWLVAAGNCAVSGCVQKSGCACLRIEAMLHDVYGQDSPIQALPAKPLADYVKVDVKLPGCPINASQLLATTASLLKDQIPYITQKPLCLECKLRENACVLIENNLPCLGPVTAAGCGALCPSVGAACYGCWGSCESPQIEAMSTVLQEKGFSLAEILQRLKTFGAPEELFARMKQKQ